MKDERLLSMRVFLAVVETGGFTTAAQSLGASQPFVSQTVQRLEERLGTKLLHRTTRGHRLTAEGEMFRNSAQRALEAVELAEAELQQTNAQISGHLRISAPIAFGLDRITPLLPAFLTQYPGLSLDLRLSDDSANLIDDGVDVAVRLGRLPDSSLMHRRLCALQRIIVAAPELIKIHGHPTHPNDLDQFPCLTWDGSRDHLNRWRFVVDGQDLIYRAQSRFQSNEGMSLYNMCLAGFGAMRMAEHLARPAIEKGSLVQLFKDATPVDETGIYAVFLPDRHVLPRLRVFIDFLIETFRTPQW